MVRDSRQSRTNRTLPRLTDGGHAGADQHEQEADGERLAGVPEAPGRDLVVGEGVVEGRRHAAGDHGALAPVGGQWGPRLHSALSHNTRQRENSKIRRGGCCGRVIRKRSGTIRGVL